MIREPLPNALATPRISRPSLPLRPLPWGALSSPLYLAGSFGLLLGLWAAVAWLAGGDLPGPATTLSRLWGLIRDPLYDRGPNDKGIGLQLFASLQRVFTGFALGSLVAIPLGILIGLSPTARRLIDPIVQILRPISPLAWFPIGLASFQAAGTATIFIIFITSLWPTVINTAFGVGNIPQTHKQVAQVFRFSRRKYLMKVVFPYSLPHMLTGLRLSLGIAWLVIVAGEMLSGGTGIGFFVWDKWNALDLEQVISAILLIGLVGLALDRGFLFLIKRFSYGEAN
ncbi:MAG TPA: nitrate ABC transporter permease [Dehalococcoidia bacterium]|nr:nitrate ABC transporter permease [Dehalococcoidia bacterium]